MECASLEFNKQFQNALNKYREQFPDDQEYPINNFIKEISNETNKLRKIKLACQFVSQIREPDKIVETNKIIDLFIAINEVVHNHDESINNDLADTIVMNNIDTIIVDLLNYCLFGLKSHVSTSTNQDKNDLESKKFILIAIIYDILWKITDFSEMIRLKLHQKEGLKAILEYISDEKFVRELSFCGKRSDILKNIDLIQSICGCIYNMSKLCDSCKFDFNELQVTSILFKFSKMIKSSNSQRMTIYLAIANTINDKQIDNITEIKEIIRDIVKLIKIGSASISTNLNLNRNKIEINNKSYDICTVECDSTRWNIVELIEGLYKFAINDNIKYFIYDKLKIKEDIVKILSKGIEIEKVFAAKLLWQLCFDKRVSQKLSEDKSLYSALINLSQNQRLNNFELNKNCQGILWCLKKFSKTDKGVLTNKTLNKPQVSTVDSPVLLTPNAVEVKVEGAKKVEKETKIKLMISYQHENRDLCLKMKKELERFGYSVLIDVDDIHGSTLEWMAEAIESSDLILICACEKYKQSPNCRAEAEYAFKLGKIIIPCILQENYVSDGWLGIIVASKIYINISIESFDSTMTKLQAEISKNFKKNCSSEIKFEKSNTNIEDSISVKKETKFIGSSFNQKPLYNNNNNNNNLNKKYSTVDCENVSGWSADEVSKWLNKINVDYRIKRQFNNCTGDTMMKFYATKREAPEYFFSAISKNGSIEVNHVFKFIDEIEKLIKL